MEPKLFNDLFQFFPSHPAHGTVIQYKFFLFFIFIIFFKFFFFLSFFVGHIHMSYFGATGTPVLDFWWRLLWVSKPI